MRIAHGSFITIKKQLYSDETIMSKPLINRDDMLMSFITPKTIKY
jgi:hypothetical protein